MGGLYSELFIFEIPKSRSAFVFTEEEVAAVEEAGELFRTGISFTGVCWISGTGQGNTKLGSAWVGGVWGCLAVALAVSQGHLHLGQVIQIKSEGGFGLPCLCGMLLASN